MSDNTTIASQSGGDVIATDDVGGVKYPRSKIHLGADGVSGGDVTVTNPFPVEGVHSSTATRTGVGDAATTTTLLAANTARKGVMIFNDSTAVLYVAFGTAAATSSDYSFQLAAGGVYTEVPCAYDGIIKGIWASDAGGNARVTEFT